MGYTTDARPLSSVVYPIRSPEPPSAWCKRSCLSERCSIFARTGVPHGESGYAPRKPDHRWPENRCWFHSLHTRVSDSAPLFPENALRALFIIFSMKEGKHEV